jgi:hypothetical protein
MLQLNTTISSIKSHSRIDFYNNLLVSSCEDALVFSSLDSVEIGRIQFNALITTFYCSDLIVVACGQVSYIFKIQDILGSVSITTIQHYTIKTPSVVTIITTTMQLLLLGSVDGIVRGFVNQGQTHQFKGPAVVTSVTVSGKKVLVGYRDGLVKVFDLYTSQSLQFEYHTSMVRGLAVLDDTIISASRDGMWIQWDWDGTVLQTVIVGDGIESICIVKNDIVVGTMSGLIHYYFMDGTLLSTLSDSTSDPTSIDSLIVHNDVLVASTQDQLILFIKDGKIVKRRVGWLDGIVSLTTLFENSNEITMLVQTQSSLFLLNTNSMNTIPLDHTGRFNKR